MQAEDYEESKEEKVSGEVQELIALIKSQANGKRRGCYICGSFAHFARNCPKNGNGVQDKQNQGRDKIGEKRCYRCGKMGHLTWRCRAPEPVEFRAQQEQGEKQDSPAGPGKQDFHADQQ